MAYTFYIFLLDSFGYPNIGLYTTANITSIQNILKQEMNLNAAHDAIWDAWKADGKVNIRYNVDDNGQLPTWLISVEDRSTDQLFHDDEEGIQMLRFAKWEEDQEQHTALFVVTNYTDWDFSELELIT